MRYLSKPLIAAALILALSTPVWAQSSTGKNFVRGPKTSEIYPGTKRLHLEGYPNDLASYKSPGFLEVAAQIIDVDGEKKVVNARKSVSIQFDLKPKSGQGETVHIESKSDEARLTIDNRTLILSGNVSGFYQIGSAPKTTISGDRATFNYSGDTLNALVESGAGSQVELVYPVPSGNADDLGPVTLRSDSLRVDEKNNAAYFTGNARAFSTSGAQKIDVTAPSVTVQRDSNGTIGLLTTGGKTVTKLDVPPAVAAAGAEAKGVGKPTHLEVTSDKATVNIATSTGVFDGNVTGFYMLQNGGAPAQKFNFNGERATIKYDATAANTGDGLSVIVTGAPVEIEVPSFDLNL